MASKRLARLAHQLQGHFIVHHMLKKDTGVAEGTAEPQYIEGKTIEIEPRKKSWARLAHRLQGHFFVRHMLKEDEGVAEATAEPFDIEVETAEIKPRSVKSWAVARAFAVGKDANMTYSEGRLDQTRMNSFVDSVLSTFGPALVDPSRVSSSGGGGGGESVARELLHRDVCTANVCGPPGLVQAVKRLLAAVPGCRLEQSDIHICE